MTSSDDAWQATIASYDRGAELYAERSTNRAHMGGLHRRFIEMCPGKSVLDLGCGPGHDGAILAASFSVLGCDPSAGLLRLALDHHELRGRVALGDSRLLPMKGDCVDGIWACASLLHVPRLVVHQALAEALRVLKPGGLLFTSMQEGPAEGPVLVGPQDTLPDRTYFYYRAERWLAELEGAGFELLEQRLKRTTEHVSPGATGWIETFARKPL